MLRRLLGRMGLSGYIPGANDFGADNRNTDAPDAPLGEAHITFLGGAKTPYSAEEAALNERGEAIPSDLVWPGKPTKIMFSNEEPLAFRYNLTITNLPVGHYIILPPMGGTRDMEGGTLLQPGEEATFEVRFPPIARENLSPQAFHFVLTRFDPRRRNDPGVVVGEDAARWVPLPSSSDFALRTDAGELRVRPWRRNAKFLLTLDDRSFLPSDVQLHILRAPTRQALAEHAEQVEMISQSLEARTSGTWRCELPPAQLRTSCWVSVRGAARVGEHQSVPVALSKPVYVRYVPWLRMGRDWAFLGTTMLGLLWLVWGIPVYKAPLVQMPVKFEDLKEGELPPGGNGEDLSLQIMSIDGKNLAHPIVGVYKDNQFVFEDFPRRLYGYRWPFNWWNGWVRPPHKIRVEASLLNSDKSEIYAKYDLKQLKSVEKGNPTSFSISTADRPFRGDWVPKLPAEAHITNGIRLNVYLPAGTTLLREAARNHQEVKLMSALDGDARPIKTLIPSRDNMQIAVRDLDLKKKSGGTLKIWAVVGDTESDPWIQMVEPQKKPFDAYLTFPGPPELNALGGSIKKGSPVVIMGNRLGKQGDVFINTRPIGKVQWSPSRVAFAMPDETLSPAKIEIQPTGSAQPIYAGTVTIQDIMSSTDPARSSNPRQNVQVNSSASRAAVHASHPKGTEGHV